MLHATQCEVYLVESFLREGRAVPARAHRRMLLQQRAKRADNRAGGLTKPCAGPISTSRMT